MAKQARMLMFLVVVLFVTSWSSTAQAMKSLWYSSSMSTSMGGGSRTTFPGIFSCSFDETTGQCVGSPNTLVDSTFINGERDRGVDLSNIRMSAWKNKLLALRTVTYWEILWAPLDADIYTAPAAGGASTMLPYFRIPKQIYTDQASGQNCNNYNTRFAYFEVLPVAFTVDDNDDVFISWEGFFQDCEDVFEAGNGLVWSIGVNKVDRSCVMNNAIQSFSDCTTPHSIFYKGLIGKDRRLGNGIGMSQSPAGRRIFYLTVVNRAFESGNPNQLWAAPPGIHKFPAVVPTPGNPSASVYQVTRIIPDVASIQLSLDQGRQAHAVCQTVYDQGVYCYEFEIEDNGVDDMVTAVSNSSEPIFVVSQQQVADSCTLDPSSNGYENYMTGLTTGLEVVWGEDHTPDVIVFGCFGRLPDRGNMTAVLRDGSAVQVFPGAYPGSLLFGIDVVREEGDQMFWGDRTPSPMEPSSGQNESRYQTTNSNDGPSTGKIVLVVFASILGVAMLSMGIMMLALRKPQESHKRESIASSISGSDATGEGDNEGDDETKKKRKKKRKNKKEAAAEAEAVVETAPTASENDDVEAGVDNNDNVKNEDNNPAETL